MHEKFKETRLENAVWTPGEDLRREKKKDIRENQGNANYVNDNYTFILVHKL